jgi:hypothetical protein
MDSVLFVILYLKLFDYHSYHVSISVENTNARTHIHTLMYLYVTSIILTQILNENIFMMIQNFAYIPGSCGIITGWKSITIMQSKTSLWLREFRFEARYNMWKWFLRRPRKWVVCIWGCMRLWLRVLVHSTYGQRVIITEIICYKRGEEKLQDS